jgi:hypothetical protein
MSKAANLEHRHARQPSITSRELEESMTFYFRDCESRVFFSNSRSRIFRVSIVILRVVHFCSVSPIPIRYFAISEPDKTSDAISIPLAMKSQTPYRGISLTGLTTLVNFFLLLAGVRADGTTNTVWQWYTLSLQTRPLLTKSTTAAVVMSVSDLLCQRLEISMQENRGESNREDLNLPSKVHPADAHRYNPTSSVSGRSTNPLFSHHDWYRTRDVAITGLTWSGPVSHTWYAILEAVVTIKHRFWGLVVRLVLDATIFSPIAGK